MGPSAGAELAPLAATRLRRWGGVLSTAWGATVSDNTGDGRGSSLTMLLLSGRKGQG